MTGFTLSGAAIVTPEGIRRDAALRIDAGRIAKICAADADNLGERITLDGGYLLPGLIDVQVNGGGGVLFNDEISVAGITAIAEAHRQFGTTGLLPTLISDTPEAIAAAIDAIDEAIAAGVPGILGIHIEGPYLNPAKRGIHDPARIAPLGDEACALLARPGRGKRLVTLAPELAPAGTVKRLRAAGVIVCAGHSMASYEETRTALDEGLDGFTHLFNAMTQFGAREPGMVGAALEDRSSRFGLIVDGHHVHPASLRVAIAARGLDGAMLVTDAMPPVGAASGHFKLDSREIVAADGALRGPDGTLAGSLLDMASAVRNACTMIGLDIGEASRLASGNPAAFLGLSDHYGAVRPGLAADLVHLDDGLAVRRVWIAGKAMNGG
jgi:N-acetylglucosamine-6-phosphate deacetylase